MRHHLFMIVAVALGLVAGAACVEVGQDAPSGYDYDSAMVAIYNPDWGQIPVPNNLLNPVKQAEIPVMIPGLGSPFMGETPTTMALPVVGEKEAGIAQELGYPVQPDSELTKALVAGMNKLNGFVTNFIVSLPFSGPVDPASIVPFSGTVNEDGSLSDANVEAANFFFLDITDPEKPIIIAPDSYYRIPDLEPPAHYPYHLYLRHTAPGPLSPPADFQRGHTYLVVATGVLEETAIRDLAGRPLKPDSIFSLFAKDSPYIREDGTVINNILTDYGALLELEGARQITNYGLEIWENLVGDLRTRNEVVTAFNFTITDNPMPNYLNVQAAILNPGGAFKVAPIDTPKNDGSFTSAKAGLNPDITFAFNDTVDHASVNAQSVRLFEVDGEGVPSAVAASVSAEDVEGVTEVTMKPSAALKPGTTYLVAANNGITGGPHNHPATDETYFGLTRVDTPLLTETDDGPIWASPYLDSRIDSLVTFGKIDLFTSYPDSVGVDGDIDGDSELDPAELLPPLSEEQQAALTQAKGTVLSVLGLLEQMRTHNAPYIEALLAMDTPASEDGDVDDESSEDGEPAFVEERENIVIFWTFTTAPAQEGR